jgi:hypothetical protein
LLHSNTAFVRLGRKGDLERLARDLRQAFPELKGFSPRNLKYMRAFAEAWPDELTN